MKIGMNKLKTVLNIPNLIQKSTAIPRNLNKQFQIIHVIKDIGLDNRGIN